MENRGKIGYAFSAAMLVCGIAIIVIGAIRSLEPWVTGIGAGLTTMGGLFLYKSLRYEKDPEYARKVDVSNTDERLSFVSGKAAMWTFQMSVMGLAILPPRVRQVMEDRNLSRDDVGALFARVLEDVGVFKWDDQGREALQRFVATLE